MKNYTIYVSCIFDKDEIKAQKIAGYYLPVHFGTIKDATLYIKEHFISKEVNHCFITVPKPSHMYDDKNGDLVIGWEYMSLEVVKENRKRIA